jgi:hypothetical protein
MAGMLAGLTGEGQSGIPLTRVRLLGCYKGFGNLLWAAVL